MVDTPAVDNPICRCSLRQVGDDEKLKQCKVKAPQAGDRCVPESLTNKYSSMQQQYCWWH